MSLAEHKRGVVAPGRGIRVRRKSVVDRCPHGGIAANGQCVLDATHPPVPCACGVPICACRACVEAHKPTCRAKGAA